MKWVLIVGAVIAAAVASMWILVFTGPHMVDQPHLLAFEMMPPAPPPGSLPIADAFFVPDSQQAETMKNPLPSADSIAARGEVYYGYYCVHCHGVDGHTRTSIAEGYMPPPTNLQSVRVQSLSDGELYRAMLTGTGHEPVLGRIVASRHRWYLVNYVRNLAANLRQE